MGVFHANTGIHLLVVPAGAAWGWKESASPSHRFTCSEGVVGCDSPTDCTAENFDCSVTAKAGFECDVDKISLQCAKDTDVATKAMPLDMACMNIGDETFPKDSTVSWSGTPVCAMEADVHFTLVDKEGGVCRGANATDNLASNYVASETVGMTLGDCKTACKGNANCKGIEYTPSISGKGRCEVWIVKPTIVLTDKADCGDATMTCDDFICLHYDAVGMFVSVGGMLFCIGFPPLDTIHNLGHLLPCELSCARACASAHVRMCVQASAHACARARVRACVHTRVRACVTTCACSCLRTCTSAACLHARAYVSVHSCVDAYVHVYVHERVRT
jgi:hypothetical protein